MFTFASELAGVGGFEPSLQPQEVSVKEIRRLIAEAGREPVERDTLYHRVERSEGSWKAGERIRIVALEGVGNLG